MEKLNVIAVIVAAASMFLIGGLWYSKALFGNVWMRENNLTEEQLAKSNKGKTFGLSFLFLLGYILLKYDFFALVMFIIIILSKLSSIYPILWIYFALIVSKSNLFYLMEREKYDEK